MFGSGNPVKKLGTDKNTPLLVRTPLRHRPHETVYISDATIHFFLNDSHPAAIDVFGVQGRLVTTQNLNSLGRGSWQWTWNGQTQSGVPVRRGIYFVRLRQASAHSVFRVVKS